MNAKDTLYRAINHGIYPSNKSGSQRPFKVQAKLRGASKMASFRVALSGFALLALAGCGKRDVSGLYLSAVDRRVTLVQLIETSDGKLTGRIQETTATSDGTLKETSANEDGTISGHDLLLRPASLWYGGVQASGSLSGDELTLTSDSFTLTAKRSTLAKYQAALTALRSVAASDQQQLAAQQAVQAANAAPARDIQQREAKRVAIIAASQRLHIDVAKINDAIDRCPNFGRAAASYTSRIERMLQVAPRLSEVSRGQLSVAANQMEVATNQIEVARSQYAIGLNQIAQDAAPIADGLQNACGSAQAVAFGVQCDDAKSAIADIKSAMSRGRSVFLPYRTRVQTELDRQAALIRRIDS